MDGVTIEEDASAGADVGTSTIFWDFRDSAWIVRVRTPGGEHITKCTHIHRRMRTPGDRLHGMSRSEAKAAAHEELCSWCEAALQGQVVGEDAAAGAVLFRV